MKKQRFFTIALILFLVGLGGLVTTNQAQAVIVPGPVCDNGEHVGNPHCVTPTPTKKPCKPTVTPTLVPSISVVPTEVSPSVTETPTATPEAMSSTGGDGKSDGRSDGLSDGRHTAPDGLGCAAHACIPSGAPATGRGY